jgi:hypothetical protein
MKIVNILRKKGDIEFKLLELFFISSEVLEIHESLCIILYKRQILEDYS